MKRMKNAILTLSVLACALLAVCLLPHASAQRITDEMPDAAVEMQAAYASPSPTPSNTLFPGLNERAITAVTITTPDRSFHFLCEDLRAISVNGQQADGEIFLTLLEQITELPVETHGAFDAQTLHPLLTIVVSHDSQQHIARFYDDGNQREIARIVTGPVDAPVYRQTSGWRVGTLIMTCEGTRIQDAYGNETPIK